MWDPVVTNGGKSLFATWVAGTTLNIDSAAGGAGTVPVLSLMAQTGLKSKKQIISLLGSEKVADGIKLKIQITAADTGYTLNQIGVWGSVEGGASTMLAIFQNDHGVTIPSKAETPDFIYAFFATIVVSNTGAFAVTIDTSAVVSQSTLAAAVEEISTQLSSKVAEAKEAADAAQTTANEKAPLNHASAATTYGVGTASNYGHLKVTSGNGLMLSGGAISMLAGTTGTVGGVQLTNSTESTSVTTAAVPASVKAAYDKAVDAQTLADDALAAAQTASAQATYYGTCTTAATTTAKALTCSGFALVTGAKISVTFTYANTASAPTLNVNGTGAKTISRLSNWEAGATADFVYDGTYWRMTGAVTQKNFYGTCATAAATVAKVVTCTSFPSVALVAGTRVSVTFTNAPTSVSGSSGTDGTITIETTTTLNVNGTGAIQIWGGSTDAFNTSALIGAWEAGQTVDFIYDGTYWRMVDATVSNSGWVTLTLQNSFTAYSGDTSFTPKVRKTGNIVNLVGQVSPPSGSVIGADALLTICTLPEGYRPTVQIAGVMQASQLYMWTIRISTAGEVTASRYRSGTAYVTPGNTSWMPFNVTFMVD